MRIPDLIGGAARNLTHSRLRTFLAVIAVTIGSFTLTLTTGIGAGVNSYITETVNAIGAPTAMEVQRAAEQAADELPVYDPKAGSRSGGLGGTELGINDQQIEDARDIPGVLSVDPIVSVQVQYIEGPQKDEKFATGLASPQLDNVFQMSHGVTPDEKATNYEVALPPMHVNSLGYSNHGDVVGKMVTFGFLDSSGKIHTIDAKVTGVILPSVVPVTTAIGNPSLMDAVAKLQATKSENNSPTTTLALTFDANHSEKIVDDVKAALTDIGLEGTTVNDRIGVFKAVIDGIVLILSGFALIALIAASFGVANTLLMSVQERTKEIGLRKALGTTRGNVFAMFAIEALVLGVLGWAVGTALALSLGVPLNKVLQDSVLQDLPGLSVYTVDPIMLAIVFAVVLGISFIAGTLPAVRAAKKDPIEALRYE